MPQSAAQDDSATAAPAMSFQEGKGVLSAEETHQRWHVRLPRCPADDVANPFEALRDAMARMKEVATSVDPLMISASPPYCPADDIINPFESLRNALAVMAAGIEPFLSAAPPRCASDAVGNPFEMYRSAPLIGGQKWLPPLMSPASAAEAASSIVPGLEFMASVSPPRTTIGEFANPFKSFRSAPELEAPGHLSPLADSTPVGAMRSLVACTPPASPASVLTEGTMQAPAHSAAGWVTPPGMTACVGGASYIDPFGAALDAVAARASGPSTQPPSPVESIPLELPGAFKGHVLSAPLATSRVGLQVGWHGHSRTTSASLSQVRSKACCMVL